MVLLLFKIREREGRGPSSKFMKITNFFNLFYLTYSSDILAVRTLEIGSYYLLPTGMCFSSLAKAIDMNRDQAQMHSIHS